MSNLVSYPKGETQTEDVLRTRCWEEYVNLRQKYQLTGEDCIMENFIIC